MRMRMVAAVGLTVALASFSANFAAQAPAPALSPGVAGAQAPPRDPRQQTPQTGTGVIRGRVVAADTGQPLRRVQIRMTSPALKEQRLTTTNAQGTFEFKELPPASYSLVASKGGYMTLQYGQRRVLEPGRPIELAIGQVLEKIDFNLPRGSVVTGRIMDEFGEPVTGARVQLFMNRFLGGQPRPMTVGVDTTDDLGQYRIFGVPPGDYYLSATLQNFSPQGVSDDRSGYALTYYPGTPSISDAQRVKLDIGQELSGIVFSLIESRTAIIRGIALDSSGKPFATATVMLRQDAGALGTTGGAVQSRPDGSFTISNVTPGDYLLEARLMNPAAPGTDPEVASTRITVAGEDITGVVLVGTKGTTARGQILFDDDGPPPSLKPSDVRVGFSAPSAVITTLPSRTTVHEDWSFEITGLIGERLLRAGSQAAGTGAWLLKAVVYDGKDVTDSPINFGTSGEVTGFQIVLTQKQTEVSGAITDSRGNPVKDYVVVLFADDSARWGFASRFVRSGRPDQQGRFRIRGLPPERYLAVAVDYLQAGEETNPETLEQLKRLATTFSLDEGESRTIELKLSAY